MRTVLVLLLLAAPAAALGPPAPAGEFLLDASAALAAAEAGRLEIPGGPTLLLARHDVRAPGFRVAVQDGAEEVVLDVAPHTFAGGVEGAPGSWARASVGPWGVLAAWAVPGGPVEGLAPAAFLGGGPDGPRHERLAPGEALEHGHLAPRSATPVVDAASPAPRAARMMIDVDEVFWRVHSCFLNVAALSSACPPQAQRWAVVAEHFVAVMDAMYGRQTGVDIQASELHAWRSTAAPYPYGTTSTVDVSDVLQAARGHWESTRPTTSDPRDLLHVFTGRPAAGPWIGVAYIAVVETSAAYAVSALPSWNTRHYTLVAHETGHNFAADHDETRSPTFKVGKTIMAATICECHEFSDGTVDPGANAVADIRGHAADRIR